MAPFYKLGPHLRAPLSDEARAWARNCPYLKALDDPTLLDVAAPGAITSFRLFMGNGDQQWKSQTGAQAAQRVIDKLAGRHPTYIEGANETGYDDVAGYTAWMADFTSYAHAHGYKVAGFSYGVGLPSENDFYYIADHGFAGVDLFSLHCYWYTSPPVDYYTALRYQYLTDKLQARSPGIAQPPFLITECGREYGGWAVNGQSAQQAVADFRQFDGIIQVASIGSGAFPLVAGAAAFTSNGPPDFSGFAIEPLAAILWPTQVAPRPCPQGCLPGTTCNQVTGVCDNNAPAPTIAGIPLPLAIAGGLGIAALGYMLIQSIGGGGNETVYGVSDIQVIDANSPIPPGYFRVDL